MANIVHEKKEDCCGSGDCAHYSEPIRLGKSAPAFAGKGFHAGKIVDIALSDILAQDEKWTLIVFYPADFTFVCPTELGDIADSYQALQDMNVEVVSVSTDTEWCHKVWADISPIIGKVQYPMLADPTGEVCDAYGVYIEAEGLADRGTFIIDPDGILRGIEVTDGPLGRNIDDTIRKISALQHMRANPGQACPAKWAKGADTLTPGADLAGKL